MTVINSDVTVNGTVKVEGIVVQDDGDPLYDLLERMNDLEERIEQLENP